LRLTRLTHRDALSRLLAPWPAPISTFLFYKNSARFASAHKRHHFSSLHLYRAQPFCARGRAVTFGRRPAGRLHPGRLIWRALPRLAKLAHLAGPQPRKNLKEPPVVRQLIGLFAGLRIRWPKAANDSQIQWPVGTSICDRHHCGAALAGLICDVAKKVRVRPHTLRPGRPQPLRSPQVSQSARQPPIFSLMMRKGFIR